MTKLKAKWKAVAEARDETMRAELRAELKADAAQVAATFANAGRPPTISQTPYSAVAAKLGGERTRQVREVAVAWLETKRAELTAVNAREHGVLMYVEHSAGDKALKTKHDAGVEAWGPFAAAEVALAEAFYEAGLVSPGQHRVMRI